MGYYREKFNANHLWESPRANSGSRLVASEGCPRHLKANLAR